jgi:hypothetical protein
VETVLTPGKNPVVIRYFPKITVLIRKKPANLSAVLLARFSGT